MTSLPLRARSCERSEPFGGVDPPGNAFTCWCYCSSHNPLGNSISMRIETIPRPDSVRARFLSSRLTAQFLIRVLSGSGTTPTRGTGEICLAVGDRSPSQGPIEPASIDLSPVARDYPSRAVERVFQLFRAATVLSRNEDELGKFPHKSHGFLLHKLFTERPMCITCAQAVNNFPLRFVGVFTLGYVKGLSRMKAAERQGKASG